MNPDIVLAVFCGVGAIAIYGGAAVLAGWLICNGVDALCYGAECLMRRWKRNVHRRTEERRVRRA